MSAASAVRTADLRAAGPGDREQVLTWNQAPDVRAASLDPRPIDPAAHARWFAARLADPHGQIWIAEVAGVAVGVVRIERERADADGRISIVLDPAWRGRGVGRAIITAACAADPGAVIAEIRPDNLASQAAFAAAGFVRCPPRDRAGALAYRWSRP
ncbi:MAG: GNAT family N-acetyltransferase [Myxococcales bacterium]|nr:GNAT family N-acetyltransferase [Myxococcales bacterium]MBK7193207.1 GNAT family N-acetyltransferase [Myxococcales bacterium]MBP6843522.1 GNAT family N-acetyltransferase [Kofleriaceae bacterium]